MLYHQNVIYAHRPWMSRTGASSEPPDTAPHNPEHAQSTCIDAAISVAQLLQLYERRYGLRRANIQAVGITCSAALLLIFAVTTRHQPDAGPAAHLSTCFRALDEFGAAWESAKQARDFLTLLQRRWELQARRLRDARGKSGSPAVHEAGSVVPSKRPRTRDEQGREALVGELRPGSRAGVEMGDVNVGGEQDWMFMGGNTTALGYGY